MNQAIGIISKAYSDKKAVRSGVPLMNHIYEGIQILDYLGASLAAKDAFAVHPICQDPDLFRSHALELTKLDPTVILYAMEYRTIANNWLCGMPKPKEPLSCLREVNSMLVADKVQNRKDFEIYHKSTHPNSANLDRYFKDWLETLSVDESFYQELRLTIANV